MSKERLNLSRINNVEFLILTKQYDKLLIELKPFIIKYTNLIFSRQFSKNKDNMLVAMLKSKHNYGAYCFIMDYYSHLDFEYIESDITYVVFIIASRYKYQGKSFIGYLQNTFAYEFMRFLYKENQVYFNHHGVSAFFDDGDSNLYDERDSIEYQLDIISGYVAIDNMTFTTKWIKEKFSPEDSLFSDLTEEERLIIIYKYQFKMSDKNIGAKLNKHFNTINYHKRFAFKKLEERFKIKYVRTRAIH